MPTIEQTVAALSHRLRTEGVPFVSASAYARRVRADSMFHSGVLRRIEDLEQLVEELHDKVNKPPKIPQRVAKKVNLEYTDTPGGAA